MAYYSSSVMRMVTGALYRSYGWMSLGLVLTSIISFFFSQSNYIYYLVRGFGIVPILLFVAQIAIIVSMQALFNRLSYGSMVMMFLAYSAMTGITLSTIFIVFEMSSILGVFFITAGIFLFMSIYGTTTQQNLSSLGLFAVSALFGILLCSLINIFIKSAFFDYTLSFIAVIAISALIAYDAQNIKDILLKMSNDESKQKKMSIFAALSMYINFVSLFIQLLHLLGKRKE